MAFATMATDSKQLYLIFHDHRTKKRKDFGCPEGTEKVKFTFRLKVNDG